MIWVSQAIHKSWEPADTICIEEKVKFINGYESWLKCRFKNNDLQAKYLYGVFNGAQILLRKLEREAGPFHQIWIYRKFWDEC